MFKQLKALWNIPQQLDAISKRHFADRVLMHDCLQKFDQFMTIARRLDESHPDLRAASDKIGAAAIAKMLAEHAVRAKQQGENF